MNVYKWSIVINMVLGIFVCDFAQAAEKLDIGRIIVTPSKVRQIYKDATANISVITAEEIAQGGYVEISQVLELLPSVEILDHGSVGSVKSVHVRGASSQQVLTLINGRVANTPRDGLVDFNAIKLNNVERIEILRGPAAAIYGANAVGGVINVITRKGSDAPQTTIETRYGDYSMRMIDIAHGAVVNNFDYFISGGTIRSNGHRDYTGYESYDLNTEVGYSFNDTNRLGVTAGYTASETGTPGPVTNLDNDDQQVLSKQYVDMTYTGSLWTDSELLVKGYHTRDRLEFIESVTPHVKDTHQTRVIGLDCQISQVFFEKYRTTFGYNHLRNRLNSSASGKHAYDVNAFYLETGAEFFDGLMLKAGARFDDYSTFGGKVSPSASFSYWWRDTLKLHGLWAKSFRAPSFNDLYWPTEDWGVWGGVEGNANLRPETADSFEMGCGAYFFDILEADVTFFYTKFKDLIEWQMDDVFWWRPENVSRARIDGLETTVRAILFKQFHTEFSHTFLNTAKNSSTGMRLSYRPKHLWKLGTTWESPVEKGVFAGIDCNAQMIYRTGRYTNTTNTRTLGDDFTVDFTLRKKVHGKATVSLSCFNLLDREYEDEENYPMPGRTLLASVKVEF